MNNERVHIRDYPDEEVRRISNYDESMGPLPSMVIECMITIDGRCWNVYSERWMIPGAYGQIQITRAHNIWRFAIHYKVGEYFVPNPEQKPYLVFIDGDRTNRKASNLIWYYGTRYLNGRRFCRLLVLRDLPGVPDHEGYNLSRVECRCDCGKIISAGVVELVKGRTTSCGCRRHEIHIQRITKHGKSNHRLHNILGNMHQRCYNSKNTHYAWYGGRGITICDEWRMPNGYLNFYNWAMANGYSDELTIDRVDSNGNYEPGNCRWATRKEQAGNTRTVRLITHAGVTRSIRDWANELHIPYSTIIYYCNIFGNQAIAKLLARQNSQ